MNLGRKRSQAEVVTKTENLSASQRILRKIERALISGWELRKAVLLAGTILSLPVFGLTACGKSTAETAGADTPAGAWTLVRMSYNGLTVEKEDLEDMDVSMALQLLEDGTGTMDYAACCGSCPGMKLTSPWTVWQMRTRWQMAC